MKTIITISREFGAAGGEIGRRLAEELNLQYYDKEIILMAARNSNLDVDRLIEWDEKVPMNFGFAQSLLDFYNRPLSEKIFQAQTKVIRQIGEKGNCVIVGRNADSILREFDGCLTLFFHADLDWRVRRMSTKMPGESLAKIEEKAKLVDQARKKYYSYHVHHDFGMADNYDISLCTSRLGIDTCVKLIKDAVLK